MSSCDHVRNVLLTDYLDGELDEGAKKKAEEHLSICPDCRRLVALAKEDMDIIRDKDIKVKAPAHLWRSIVNSIENEKRANNPVSDILRGFAERFTMPRLAPALIGIILLVLGSSFFLHTQRVNRIYAEENFAYVSELFANGGVQLSEEHDGLGTPIEEYFL